MSEEEILIKNDKTKEEIIAKKLVGEFILPAKN